MRKDGTVRGKSEGGRSEERRREEGRGERDG
jgi:hypothetical protein